MSSKTSDALIVRCPTCSKSTRYDPTNADRPFCSSRCKTMDIAQWAEGSFRIPAKESSPGESSSEEEEKFAPPEFDDDI